MSEMGHTQNVIREMGLTERDVEKRRRFVDLGTDDVKRLVALQPVVSAHVESFVASFFDYLSRIDEAKPLFLNHETLERARKLKREHLLAMVSGDYSHDYAAQRIRLAALYASAGLETRLFLGAFHHLLKAIGDTVMRSFQKTPMEGFEHFISLEKVAFFDVGLIVDVMLFERQRVIRQQQEAIRELSTPVLQIRDRLLLLPIIGVIDTHRARIVTESLLRAIRANRARVVVMDVTGVATIDSKVANHLLQTVAAARLMGAHVIITGLSSEVAQSLVALGIDLSKLNTVGDLQGGLEDAEKQLGYRVTLSNEPVPA